ncbi:MAG: class I SAM-dependent methyltransferase, partial [Chitinophagaceae bacterium]
VFQNSILLRDWGILAEIEACHKTGISLVELREKFPQYSHYAIRVLVEGGLGIGLILRDENRRFRLSKTGYFFLNDKMTIANTDFMRDVCLPGANDLGTSLENGKPEGLHHFGEWPTVYDGLSQLPKNVQKSWFQFDHFYSDNAFPIALDYIFNTGNAPKRMLDIGSNTGKWALTALAFNPSFHIGLADLPGQLNMAIENLKNAGYDATRFTPHVHNVLDNNLPLPLGYDTIWMSQFLDCFSDEEIVNILRKCHTALPDDGYVVINETFWDRQRFPASAFSLHMTSLYFTSMANGNSQMYDSEVFLELIASAGFKIVDQMDHVGMGHTLLRLAKA